MATKYVYTFSSKGRLPVYLLHSIKSLIQFVDPSDVIVFATPPVDDSDLQTFESLGVDVRRRNHVSDAFAAHQQSRHYGDKLHLTTVESDSLVFLDCDTLIFDDPSQLVTDAQFRARPDVVEFPPGVWEEMFKDRGEPAFEWMPNAGVLVFNDGFHRKIASQWRSYLNSDLPKLVRVYHKEQYALSLAIAGHDTDKLSPIEHVFEWEGESPSDGVVYHSGSVFGRIGLKEELRLKWTELRGKFL